MRATQELLAYQEALRNWAASQRTRSMSSSEGPSGTNMLSGWESRNGPVGMWRGPTTPPMKSQEAPVRVEKLETEPIERFKVRVNDMDWIADTSCCGLATIESVDHLYHDLDEEWGCITDYALEAPDWRPIAWEILRARVRVAIYATLIENQDDERDLLELWGFKPIQSFINPNTGNEVTIWFVGPREEAK
jgi:hypothetical protein